MSASPFPTAHVFGVDVGAVTMDQAVAQCAAVVERGSGAQHVVLNAGKVVMMHRDPRLRQIVRDCEIVNADGQSIVWAGHALGQRIPERVTGIDLMAELLALAETKGWSAYFLGATPEVLRDFLRVVELKHPNLIIAGAADGYFEDDSAAARAVAASGARLLFVAMPSPRKEYFLAEQRTTLSSVFAMGVGGSFDVWAGLVKRAPAWMGRSGLEWLYRLVQEPRRMWRRYLIGNLQFGALLLTELLSLPLWPTEHSPFTRSARV